MNENLGFALFMLVFVSALFSIIYFGGKAIKSKKIESREQRTELCKSLGGTYWHTGWEHKCIFPGGKK